MNQRPNILVFLTDDHARWAVGCYGNPAVHTPTLDYLARTGARMNRAFTPNPVCSPSRASFLTGLLPSQHGIHDFLGSEAHDHPGLDGLTTLPMIMQAAGYQTALCGKWHAGQEERIHAGFDLCFSLGPDYPYIHSGPHRYLDQGQPVKINGFVTDVVTDRAVHFLTNRDSDKPFFMMVTLIGTHSPWAKHPERLVSGYREHDFAEIVEGPTYPHAGLLDELIPPGRENPREIRAQYYGAIAHIDEAVGRVVDTLDAGGMRDNTMLVYTADHGLNLGQHGIWGKANSTIPSNMVEETISIPMIVNYPNEIRPGMVRSEVVDLLDLFSTLLDYAEADLPGDHAYPGKSFRRLAAGRHIPGWRDAQFCEYGHLRMIRTRTHKLIRRYPDGPHELFDLEHDPGEVVNHFNDPAYAELITDLTARLEAHFSAYEDPVKTGLKVREGPLHNGIEPWRDGWQDKYESDYRG